MLSRLHRPGLVILAVIFLLEVPLAAALGPGLFQLPLTHTIPDSQVDRGWLVWMALMVSVAAIGTVGVAHTRWASVRNTDRNCRQDLDRRVDARAELYRLVPALAPAAVSVVPIWSACWQSLSPDRSGLVSFMQIAGALVALLLVLCVGVELADSSRLTPLLEQLAILRLDPRDFTAEACRSEHAPLLLRRAGLRGGTAATALALRIATESPYLVVTDLVEAANAVTSGTRMTGTT